MDKGRKLCTARYVYDVEECDPQDAGSSRVTAKCHSQVKNIPYNITIQVSS